MQDLVGLLNEDEKQGMADLEGLLAKHPKDPRLHFLKGSILAGNQNYRAARDVMRRAVELAPDYAVARFQLGFLLLTEGEPYAAQEVWGPLQSLPDRHYLKLMAGGLTHMINDRFDDAIDMLKAGMAQNQENPPLNGNIQMLIDEMRRKMAEGGGEEEPVSAVDMLLRQSPRNPTKH